MRLNAAAPAKLAVIVIAPVLLLSLTTSLLLRWTGGFAREEIVTSLSAIASTSISLIDVQRIARVAAAPGNTALPDYGELRAELQRVRGSAPQVRYVYLIGRKDNNFIFLVDAEPETSTSFSAPGSVLATVDAPTVRGIRQAISSGRLTIAGPYEDRWGKWVSALTPILDAEGNAVAVFGIDVPAERWYAEIGRYREFGLLISALVATTVLLGAGLVLMQQRSARRLEDEIARQKVLEARLRELTQIDELTQIANRRRFDETFESQWRRALRRPLPLALLMSDIDRFKSYNDAYGHVEGDRVLSMVAQAIGRIMRDTDLVARYGGEEFVVILPGADLAEAAAVAERIRHAVEDLNLPHAKSPHEHLTISIGAAMMIPDADSAPRDLLTAADRALYLAKSRGGNVVAS